MNTNNANINAAMIGAAITVLLAMKFVLYARGFLIDNHTTLRYYVVVLNNVKYLCACQYSFCEVM